MNEYEKARILLERNALRTSAEIKNDTSSRRIAISSDSVFQHGLLEQCITSCNCGAVILTSNSPNAIWRKMGGAAQNIVICNSNQTKTYHPFDVHSESQIYNMLCSLPGINGASPGLKLLLRAFSKLLAVDKSLLDTISSQGLSADLLEARIARMRERHIINHQEADALSQKISSNIACLDDLEVLLCDLFDFSAKMIDGTSFRIAHTLQSVLSARRNIFFVFDSDYSSNSGFDRMLLPIVAADMEQTLKNSLINYTLVIDDLPYTYVKAFEWVFSQNLPSIIINLASAADYHINARYTHIIRSKIDYYLVFNHQNQDLCRFWSDSFGTSRIIEYNYSSSNTVTTKYPLFEFANNLLGSQQQTNVSSYHYVDKNLYPDYEIRNLLPNEFFFYERQKKRLTKRILSV